MRSSRHFVPLSIALGLTWAFIAAPASAQPPPEPLPSAIEEALIEYACGQLHPAGTVESDAYLDCRRNRLTYLRAEFGRDLRRLSATERKTIDTACSDLRASRGQDAYVQCLQAKLATLPGHGKTKAEPAGGAAVPPPVPSMAPPPAPPPVAPSASRLSPLTVGAALAALIAAGAGVLLLKKRAKPASGACRTCGAALPGHGELCPNCRHEAAEALRHASTERAAHARAEEDANRQVDQERGRQQAREDEERRRELEATQAAEAAAARQQEDDARRRREDDAWRQQQVDATAAPGDFDAHAALGVPRGASAADIDAAYQTARAKYDLDLVADLGNELQEHYRRKAAATQRAYELLTAPRAQS